MIEVHEDLDHCVVEIAFLACRSIRRTRHGKCFAVPVTGSPKALKLPDDRTARFPLLFPDFQCESITTHLSSGQIAFLGHFTLCHHLCSDAGVVGSGLPKGVEAAHPMPTDQNVLQGVVECMPHVQRACHVRGRNHDAECF